MSADPWLAKYQEIVDQARRADGLFGDTDSAPNAFSGETGRGETRIKLTAA